MEQIVTQLVTKFPAFYATERFINVSTRAWQWSVSWAKCIQSKTSHPTSLRSIPILSSNLCQGLLSGLVPSGFPTNILYIFFICPMRPTLTPIIILDLITQTVCEQKNLWSFSSCSLLEPPATLSLLGSNIFLTIFNLCSSRIVSY